jgi:hypothetical protein
VVDVPVGGPPAAGVVSAMIASTIPSKRKRIPKQFFEAPAAAADSPGENRIQSPLLAFYGAKKYGAC